VADLSRCVAKRIGHWGLLPVRIELLARTKEKRISWQDLRKKRRVSVASPVSTKTALRWKTSKSSLSVKKATVTFPSQPAKFRTTKKLLFGIDALGALMRWAIVTGITQP
jgi:uncharacterized protein involved in outer membrane biogenesis